MCQSTANETDTEMDGALFVHAIARTHVRSVTYDNYKCLSFILMSQYSRIFIKVIAHDSLLYFFWIPHRRSHRKSTKAITILKLAACNFFALPRHSLLLLALESLHPIHSKNQNDQKHAIGVLFSILLPTQRSRTLSQRFRAFLCSFPYLFAINSHPIFAATFCHHYEIINKSYCCRYCCLR